MLILWAKKNIATIIFVLFAGMMFVPVGLHAEIPAFTSSSSYNTSSDKITEISTVVKDSIQSIKDIYKNILWVVSFLVFLTMLYAGAHTYFRIKERKERGQDIPAVYKFGKILTNVVLVLFVDYVALGIFATTFANSPSSPATFNGAWNAIVVSFFSPIFQ